MSDLDAHLLAILADPASTLARMTFADRLDDDGQAERAEFIRLQAGLLPGAKCADRCTGKRDANVRCSTCGPIKERIRALAFAATPCWHGFDRLTAATCLQCASTELHNRVGGYDTLTNAAADWLGFAVSNPADTRPIQWWWTRGFVGRVRMTWAAWQLYSGDLFAHQPVVRAELTDRRPYRVSLPGINGGGYYAWAEELTAGVPESCWLPGCLIERMYSTTWQTEGEAVRALSRALVDDGRRRAAGRSHYAPCPRCGDREVPPDWACGFPNCYGGRIPVPGLPPLSTWSEP